MGPATQRRRPVCVCVCVCVCVPEREKERVEAVQLCGNGLPLPGGELDGDGVLRAPPVEAAARHGELAAQVLEGRRGDLAERPARARVRMRACVRACVRACACACVCVCV